jgi:DNA-binding CsgD family transcriptional regulator
MSLTCAEEVELITAVHEGPLEQHPWSTFLRRLAASTRADYAYLHLLHGGAKMTDASGFFHIGRRPKADVRERYYRELHRFDPVPHRQMQTKRIYAIEDLLEPTNANHTRFKREFLEPAGMTHGRIIRVIEPSGGSAWLMISRQHGNFRAEDDELIGTLAPHLTIALRCYTAIGRERLRARLSEDVVHSLNFGWMMLDAEGLLIDYDAGVKHLLEHSDAICRSSAGRLTLSDAEVERAVRKALRSFATSRNEKPRAIHIADEPWLDILLLPIGDRAVLGAGEKPVSVAYVHGEEQSGAARIDHLRQLFGLSSCEAGLALALSRGRTIAEGAQELGLTIETARNYSKRIYAKTGTRGQTDLVRLILASVVALV